MSRLIWFVGVLLLVACTKAPPVAQEDAKVASDGMVQCSKDTDCKGDRICDQGSCKAPSSPLAAPAESPVAPAQASASATDAPAAKWVEGFGQGNLEYFIDVDGLRLYIGCPTQEGSADASSSVALRRIADNAEVTGFTISVNGKTYEGPFSADYSAGESSFIALLEDLQKADATVSFGGKAVVFPKSNASAVLPTFGSAGFSCNLM